MRVEAGRQVVGIHRRRSMRAKRCCQLWTLKRQRRDVQRHSRRDVQRHSRRRQQGQGVDELDLHQNPADFAPPAFFGQLSIDQTRTCCSQPIHLRRELSERADVQASTLTKNKRKKRDHHAEEVRKQASKPPPRGLSWPSRENHRRRRLVTEGARGCLHHLARGGRGADLAGVSNLRETREGERGVR